MAAISVTPADVSLASNSELTKVQYGEAVTAGQSIYKAGDNKYYKAVCTDVTKAGEGIAMIGGAADYRGYAALNDGYDVDIGGTVTVGEVYVTGDTAGGIMPIGDLASTEYVFIVGYGKTATNILTAFNDTGIVKP